jgi:hypothetical protein
MGTALKPTAFIEAFIAGRQMVLGDAFATVFTQTHATFTPRPNQRTGAATVA